MAAIFPGEMIVGADVGVYVATAMMATLARAFGKPYVFNELVTAPVAVGIE